MVYRTTESLNLFEIKGEYEEKVSFDFLGDIIEKSPTNIIYFEKGGYLQSLISMGDIFRASKLHKDFVCPNKKFTKLVGLNNISAKRIFSSNPNINDIPVVDKDNHLIGAYSRWDDNTFESIYRNTLKNVNVGGFYKGKMLSLVEPVSQTKKEKFYNNIEALRYEDELAEFRVVTIDTLTEAFEQSDNVIFFDEDEMRGIGTLFNEILDIRFDWRIAKTFSSIIDLIDEYINYEVGMKAFSKLLSSINEEGAHVLLLRCDDNGSEYYKRTQSDIKRKCELANRDKLSHYLAPEWYKEFFGELYSKEYAEQIVNHHFQTEVVNGERVLKDYVSDLFNVKNNERVTVNQPLEYEQRVFFLGPCLIVGHLVEDRYTIESCLQRILNEKGYPVKVINLGSWSTSLDDAYRVSNLPLRRNDIVVAYIYNPKNIDLSIDIPDINIVDVLERNNVSCEWFDDLMVHGNHRVNHLYAQSIFEEIKSRLCVDEYSDEVYKKEADQIMIEAYCNKYFMKNYYQNNLREEKIGSIVMNCNPFTKGHRYLIEYALSIVDRLVIFVVEEDGSLFTFKERYAMVIEGTADLEDVVVVPSGWYILSQKTFPEYFLKVEDENIKSNTENDIRLFAQYIAPMLNIKYRFTGQEQNDPVTKEYNNAMEKIFKQYGINYIEIPRKKFDDKVISASYVRQLLECNKLEDLLDYIPMSTYKYITGRK